MSALLVGKHNFEQEVLQSSQPVLVDFWAAWCGPCKMFAPTIEKVAQEQQGKVKVVKINVDEEPELAARFGVMSIPTLVLMKEGKIAATSMGVKPKYLVDAMLAQ